MTTWAEDTTASRGLRLGIDIGGTFTDFALIETSGDVRIWKEDSDPVSPASAIEAGLTVLAEQTGRSTSELLAATELLVHGTTRATNVVVQRSGPQIGLLCTAGFRDVLYFRDGYKPDRFNVHMPRPADFVARYLRQGVTERVGPTGDVLVELDEQEVRDAACVFREAGVAAVAVALLWSVVNPVHEHRAAAILREELPDVHVFASADVLPEIGEWKRTSATALSAYVMPAVASYLDELQRLLQRNGYTRSAQIMQINGGCASINEILQRPVTILASGPAAAPAAALSFARDLDERDLIVLDMGGTSLDVCVIRQGSPTMSRTIRVLEQPIGVPGVEIHSVGAGGGSIAWIDEGGALCVGPQSAGARPGPAAYGLGGAQPTVTDASVVLGYLAPTAFLGGRRTLDASRAFAAVEQAIAAPLGLSVLAAAAGIIRIVDSNMVDAIRAVSIERGIDPRSYTLVAGGGAGGLHAGRLARELGVARVLIPHQSSTLCAFGMTVTDVRHDYSRPLPAMSDDVDLDSLQGLISDLKHQARSRLVSEGFSEDQVDVECSVDGRYPGQVHLLTIPFATSDQAVSSEDVAAMAANFHAAHEQQFSYSRPDLPIELMHWRVAGIGRLPSRVPTRTAGDVVAADDRRVEGRRAYSPESGEMVEFRVCPAEGLGAGQRVDGPAIVQAETTTILVAEGDVLHGGAHAMVLEVSPGGDGRERETRS